MAWVVNIFIKEGSCFYLSCFNFLSHNLTQRLQVLMQKTKRIMQITNKKQQLNKSEF